MITRPAPVDSVRHVAIVALDDVRMSSLGVMVDAMAMVAAQVERQFDPAYRQPMRTQARLLGLRSGTVRMSGGRPFELDGTIDRREAFRLVYVPALDVHGETDFERRLRVAAPLYPWLQRQRRGRAVFAAAGSAVLLLAEAGLLDDGSASVPRALLPMFRRRYPRVRVETRDTLTDHGGIIFTAAKPGAEWSLAVHAIEASLSPQMASWLAVTAGLRRTGSPDDGLSDDPLVASAQFWLGERFAEPGLRIAALARHLAVSHATLIRRFQHGVGVTPRSYVRRLRVDAARTMLESTHRSVQQIALMVGYADARAFRDVFREATGMSPMAWRSSRL